MGKDYGFLSPLKEKIGFNQNVEGGDSSIDAYIQAYNQEPSKVKKSFA